MIATASDALRRQLATLLSRPGYQIDEWRGVAAVPLQARMRRPDLVIVEAPRDRPEEGIDAAREIRRWDPAIPVILIAERGSEALAVAALRAGVSDYFNETSAGRDLLATVRQWVSAPAGQEGSAVAETGDSVELLGAERMIGHSSPMQAVRSCIATVAPSDCNALITGETGTGKELVAELIHCNSPRRNGPLVCINCAAIPDTLVESELFGYDRGAFSGAHATQPGNLQLGQGGTVLFDEIGDMSLYAQAKILRVIESRQISRLGGRAPIPIDVRLVAATNHDLEQLVADGKFRRDLYFRLNVVRIQMPPLRERREDIPLLVGHFVDELNRRFGLRVAGFAAEAMERLLGHSWPGNIRELRNLLEAIFVRRPGHTISSRDLPEWLQRGPGVAAGHPAAELDRLLAALSATNWNKSKAAEQLQWSRMTLYRKLAKYKLANSGPGTAGAA